MSDRAALRAAYKRLLAHLSKFRDIQDAVYSPGDPDRAARLAECDQALVDLKLLGRAVGEMLILQSYEGVEVQPVLLDVPEKKRGY